MVCTSSASSGGEQLPTWYHHHHAAVGVAIHNDSALHDSWFPPQQITSMGSVAASMGKKRYLPPIIPINTHRTTVVFSNATTVAVGAIIGWRCCCCCRSIISTATITPDQ